jgi:hypothetical protein
MANRVFTVREGTVTSSTRGKGSMPVIERQPIRGVPVLYASFDVALAAAIEQSGQDEDGEPGENSAPMAVWVVTEENGWLQFFEVCHIDAKE